MTDAAQHEAEFLNELGRRVRHARTVRGLSRKLLSQASGLSERYIAQLEGGQGNVSIILLRRVANAMGMRLDDLVAAQETSSDWRVVRDLLEQASPDQIALAKSALAGSASVDNRVVRRRVAVVGLRGAGKSTLGRMAAAHLGWRFVELNTEIERENGPRSARSSRSTARRAIAAWSRRRFASSPSIRGPWCWPPAAPSSPSR